MDLKALLGDKYKDGMTFEEMCTALANIDPTAGFIKKDQFDRVSSELAKAKKDLAAKMTADEAAEAERKANEEKMTSRLAELEKDKAVSEHKARLLGLGYEESLAAETAAALADGDMDTVFANQKKHQETQEKALKAKLLDETPKPPAPGASGAEKSDGEKLAETLGKANAETKKAAGDIISQYTGG